jgi:hypothetical protein
VHLLPFARRAVDIGSAAASIGAQMLAGDRALGIVNVHALLEPPSGLPPAVAMSYDGESASERQEQRVQRWTPVAQAA